MASPVRVMLRGEHAPASGGARACEEALDVFHRLETERSRFDAASDLSRVNGAPDRWHRVGPYCYLALEEAWHAYRWSEGRFDPRVLADLVALGYDRWPPREEEGDRGARTLGAAPTSPRARWRPRLVPGARVVHVDGARVDLGGIGKGLAVRWASRALGRSDHLVEAGGDCYCAGTGPDGGPWRVGVEDPSGGDLPLAVLAVSDLACTTSSVQRRRWVSDGRPVHHLIDPLTGRPGGTGLLSVSVIGPDPAVSEVWSKVLFLYGATTVEEAARRHGIAACWVTDDGTLHLNARAGTHVLWRR